jgi:hypothetical protein
MKPNFSDTRKGHSAISPFVRHALEHGDKNIAPPILNKCENMIVNARYYRIDRKT